MPGSERAMPRKQTRRQSQGAAALLVLAVVAVGWLLLVLARALILVLRALLRLGRWIWHTWQARQQGARPAQQPWASAPPASTAYQPRWAPYQPAPHAGSASQVRSGVPPAVASRSYWQPEGSVATINGMRIAGGFLYVGDGLASVSGLNPEPALIDPTARIAPRSPDVNGQYMSYWPSYSAIRPESRAAYLMWLQSGRSDPRAYIGYVFLYFYGLERRIIVDGQALPEARAEIPRLRAEVERLYSIYNSNHSFRGYSHSLLATMSVLYPELVMSPPQDDDQRSWELPIWLKLSLGRAVQAGQPIGADLALAWYQRQPYVTSRTPARRCPEEFAQLFTLKYQLQFGAGMVVRPPKRRLSLEYHPASGSFGGRQRIGAEDVPDVSELAGPVNKLCAIAEECCSELDQYSRVVGRSGSGRDTLAAMSCLPAALVSGAAGQAAQLRSWLEQKASQAQFAEIDGGELIKVFAGVDVPRLSALDATRMVTFLQRLGFGVEPDSRSGGAAIETGKPAVVFRIDPAATFDGSTYRVVKVIAELASGVALADGVMADVERKILSDSIEGFPLSMPERLRLHAFLRWLEIARPGASGLAKRVALVPMEQRTAVGELLVAIAGADGYVAPAEVDVLKRAYRTLDLDQESVYSTIHGLAVAPATTPVTVRPPTGTERHALPPAPTQSADGGYRLDMAIVAAKLKDSEHLSALLSGVFAEEAAVPTFEPVAGLNETHSELVRALGQREGWSRDEYQELVRRFGLMPAGAIESINDAAYERTGAPLIEDGDRISLDPAVLKEMLA